MSTKNGIEKLMVVQLYNFYRETSQPGLSHFCLLSRNDWFRSAISTQTWE